MAITEEGRKARNAYMREYRRKNKDAYNQYQREYREKNKEKMADYKNSYWDRKVMQLQKEGLQND